MNYTVYDRYESTSPYSKDGSLLFSDRDKVVLFEMVQLPKNGCVHCGTSFLMSDLYPRVTSYFFMRDYSRKKTELIKWMVPFVPWGSSADPHRHRKERL